jgi:hypothetical protein
VIALEFFDRDYPDWTEPGIPYDTPLFTAELLAVSTFETILNTRSLWT